MEVLKLMSAIRGYHIISLSMGCSDWKSVWLSTRNNVTLREHKFSTVIMSICVNFFRIFNFRCSVDPQKLEDNEQFWNYGTWFFMILPFKLNYSRDAKQNKLLFETVRCSPSNSFTHCPGWTLFGSKTSEPLHLRRPLGGFRLILRGLEISAGEGDLRRSRSETTAGSSPFVGSIGSASLSSSSILSNSSFYVKISITCLGNETIWDTGSHVFPHREFIPVYYPIIFMLCLTLRTFLLFRILCLHIRRGPTL